MREAVLPLQKAIVTLLRNRNIAGVGTKVLDGVDPDTEKPYISIGPWDTVPEEGDLYDGQETSIQIDAWAAGPGSVEIKRIGSEVHDALQDAQDLDLEEDQRLVSLEVVQVRYLTEPDGITQHCVITASARTEPTD